jgi:hypothetical protein
MTTEVLNASSVTASALRGSTEAAEAAEAAELAEAAEAPSGGRLSVLPAWRPACR